MMVCNGYLELVEKYPRTGLIDDKNHKEAEECFRFSGTLPKIFYKIGEWNHEIINLAIVQDKRCITY